jgi:hypothetical protein
MSAAALILAVTLGSSPVASATTPGALPQRAAAFTTDERAATASDPISGLHVRGIRIVNAEGQPVQLAGVTYAGTEYACWQGWGVFDGPYGRGLIRGVQSWGTNTVVVPLNESCWLGVRGVPTAYSKAAYRDAISAFVARLTRAGLVAEVRLMWLTDRHPGMPDRRYAPSFWRSVAERFQNNRSVIFGLLAEPYPLGNRSDRQAWQCWRDGGCASQYGTAAGMQELVDVVRRTGARNIISLSGIGYGGQMDRFLEFLPRDPLGNLIAAPHVYAGLTPCRTVACWDSQYAPIAARMPLVAGELGEREDTCDGRYARRFMRWADAHDAGYQLWTWNVWRPRYCLSLIDSFDGTPRGVYGNRVREHLRTRARMVSASHGGRDATATTEVMSGA